MLRSGQNRISNFSTGVRGLILAGALVAALVLIPSAARAQTFSVLHTFTGGMDGSFPLAGLSQDRAGNLYGTTETGGHVSSSCGGGCGVVFKLAKKNGQWLFAPLYSFQGGNDGRYPDAPVTISPDGSLYGTTYLGGTSDQGTVFRLQPPPGVCKSLICPWLETVLYSFNGNCPPCDGVAPGGQLVFDQLENLYGTSFEGGSHGNGTVYKLTPSGGRWTENVVYSFNAFPDGTFPYAGVLFDNAGNLYGTTTEGGATNDGTVYQLKPSGAGWTETLLHSFSGADGSIVQAGLIRDSSGNLYGAASQGGGDSFGTIFELTPSGGSWTFNLLFSLEPHLANQPLGSLAMDAAGNVYGAGRIGGSFGYGQVFKLAYSDGLWLYSDLHDFTGGSDGGDPYGNLLVDAAGNLYGTANSGGGICGGFGCGVVWMITAN